MNRVYVWFVVFRNILGSMERENKCSRFNYEDSKHFSLEERMGDLLLEQGRRTTCRAFGDNSGNSGNIDFKSSKCSKCSKCSYDQFGDKNTETIIWIGMFQTKNKCYCMDLDTVACRKLVPIICQVVLRSYAKLYSEVIKLYLSCNIS